MARVTRRKFIRQSVGTGAALLGASMAPSAMFSFSPQKPSGRKPNIILMMADDMGFSDISCYGSEIDTPNLNRLASEGLRFHQFYNCARCCPTRASLMTGLYPHQAGFGLMTDDLGSPAYRGDLSARCVTIAEALRLGGYRTAMSGKWHLTPAEMKSKHNWPMQRGYERFFGTIEGSGSFFDPVTLTRGNTPIRAEKGFYYTDAIADNAVQDLDSMGRGDSPFFMYVAFTSPHWPLQALEGEIDKYRNRYHGGWDALRAERHKRMIEMGVVEEKWPLSPRDSRVPPWEVAPYQDWESMRMAVYAAQIDRMDQNIGKILAKVRSLGIEENTLILFLSDNGGNLEEILKSWKGNLFLPQRTLDGRLVEAGNDPTVMPGPEETFQSYGIPWANTSNTPFRRYKHYTHEGGISTPLIAHCPAIVSKANSWTNQIGHVMDVMATCLDVAGIEYPRNHHGQEITPLEGQSLLPIFRGSERPGHDAIFWEHEGNSAVRQGKWKLVSANPDYWELHDMEADRTELNDLATKEPERVRQMAALYEQWAKHVGVRKWPLHGPAPVPEYLDRSDP